MTIIKGGQYYHWYFGPVRVIEINDDQVSVYIKFPDGIYKESQRTQKTGNFSYRNFDEWFFREPYLITNSIHFKKDEQHRFYYPEFQIYFLESEIARVSERIAKNNEIICNKDKSIVITQKEISSIDELRSYESMNKELMDEKLEEYQGRLTALSIYIENVVSGSIKSPRELKSGLEKLPEFFKEKEELIYRINQIEESIELKFLEIDSLSRKITSLKSSISKIEKENEDKRKVQKSLSYKVDKLIDDVEKIRLFLKNQ